jgi:hypothetical protein
MDAHGRRLRAWKGFRQLPRAKGHPSRTSLAVTMQSSSTTAKCFPQSMVLQRSTRSSRPEAPCRSARIPTSPSWGWTVGSVVQRRNSRRCWSMLSVLPRNPLNCLRSTPRFGSMRTRWRVRANRTNHRSTVSRRGRSLGCRLRKSSMSMTSTLDHFCFPRSSLRNSARSRKPGDTVEFATPIPTSVERSQ